MRAQSSSLFSHLRRPTASEKLLGQLILSHRRNRHLNPTMYSNHDNYSSAPGRSSQPYRSDDFRRRGYPAYEDPDVYDTSKYSNEEHQPASPRRSKVIERSPTWRRSHSPPVFPPAPLPSNPSPEYLAISAETPCAVDPETQRKLLILDLNGTLLWRKDKRVPYPRAYMPAFRAYLFSDETRKWLDVMVWSSAQPHNVNMMVRRCFFDPRCGYVRQKAKTGFDEWDDLLIAVWARDTLGLSSHDYCTLSLLSITNSCRLGALPHLFYRLHPP